MRLRSELRWTFYGATRCMCSFTIVQLNPRLSLRLQEISNGPDQAHLFIGRAIQQNRRRQGAASAASRRRALLTTNQGVVIADNQNSLKAAPRGPTLLEDFILGEKITHFDHERIPERIVHARGSGAHGFFEVTQSLSQYTKADFLQRAGDKTPVFVRFSTVAGGAGSGDLARDVRGFATKFYTRQGNFD